MRSLATLSIAGLVILTIMISGCTMFVPVKPPKWPDAVPELTKKCEELKVVAGTQISLVDLMKTVVQNYTLYYECSNKVEGWNEWYTKQKEIYEQTRK